MAKKTTKSRVSKKPEATFDVRFSGAGIDPESIPLRNVTEALSAVQDLASGRDPFEMQHVPTEKSIGLLDVRRGSAVYRCVSRAPEEAIENLERVGLLLSSEDELDQSDDVHGDVLVASLSPIESLSDVARSLKCRVDVFLAGDRKRPLFTVHQEDYERISRRVLLEGETTVTGRVERVGGATGMRCLLRVPGRRKILYCDVRSEDVVRRLGQHLYEDIVASGLATWIHRSWRIFKFTVYDFTQPSLGDPIDALKRLRGAGLSAWDKIDNPEKFVREMQ